MIPSWLFLVAMLAMSGEFLVDTESETQSDLDNKGQSIDFSRDVAPVFAKNCVACHNSRKAEGGLDLESHQSLLKGGDSGLAIEAGNSMSGTLLYRVLDDDDPMPPVDNAVGASRLTTDEIAMIRSWVEAGATPPSETSVDTFRWQPLPDSIHPVYAMSASPDGNYIAFGRGSQAFIIRQNEIGSTLRAFELVDESVSEYLRSSTGTEPQANAAHLDIVQSIAFSPDSQTVATGGYRDVKLWRRRTKEISSLQAAISFAEPIANAVVSPDGSRVAASQGPMLEIVHLASGQASRYLKSHMGVITAFTWMDDSSHLISTDSSGNIILTNCSTNAVTPLAIARYPSPTSEQSSIESLPATTESEAGERAKGEDESPDQNVFRWLEWLGGNRLAAIDNSGSLQEITLDIEKFELAARSVPGFTNVTALHAVASPQHPENTGTDTLLALGTEGGTCRVVNSSSWHVVKEINAGEPIRSVALSPSGGLLATSSHASPAKLWRLEDGVCIATLDRDYHFSQEVSNALRNANRQQALMDRLKTRLEEVTKAAEAEEAAKVKVQETRDKAAQELSTKEAAETAASSSVQQAEQALADSEAALTEAMKLVETRKTELEGQRKALEEAKSQKAVAASELASRDQALATALDASQRAAGRIPETQQLLSSQTEKLEQLRLVHQNLADQHRTPKDIQKLCFDDSGEQILVADNFGKQHVYSVADGNPIAVLTAASAISNLRALPDNSLVALTSNGTALTWDLSLPWELDRTIGSFQESPWSDRVTALDFSPDGKQLAVGSGAPSRSGEVKIVSPETGELVLDLGEAHSDTVFAIKYSPDGILLASGGADKQCRLFDAATGSPRGVLEGHTHHVLALSWKDDATTLASGSADVTVKLWNVDTGTQIRTVGGFKKEVTSLAFVGQSDQLIATDASGLVQLLSAGDGKQIRAFAGADSAVYAIGLSPDGKLLFAGGQTGSQWTWQIEDGQKLK